MLNAEKKVILHEIEQNGFINWFENKSCDYIRDQRFQFYLQLYKHSKKLLTDYIQLEPHNDYND